MSYNGFMVAQLLATKLYIPPLRPGTVSRLRLIEQLNEGLRSGHKLTLVSASAGFGKATLVSKSIQRNFLPHPYSDFIYAIIIEEYGLAGGISLPVNMGLCIEKVEISERSTAMGLHQTIYSLGGFIGPWLSGILADAIGIQPMFGITAFACLALGLLGVHFLSARRTGERAVS